MIDVAYGSVKNFCRVDLCHQPEDEDDEDEERSFEEGLLEKISSKPSTSNTDWSRRWWVPVRLPHVGSRQNLVILVHDIMFFLASCKSPS